MKFTNGNWLKRKGVESFSPAEIYDMKFENGGRILKLYAPAHIVYNRGCTLGGVAITIRISNPAQGVFRIGVSHFEGITGKKPEFELEELEDNILDIYDKNRNSIDTNIDLISEKLHKECINIISGNARLEITSDIQFNFYNGDRYLTCIKPEDIAYIRSEGYGDAYVSPEDINYIKVATNLSVSEHIYGLGERFGPFIKNGQSIAMWNEDGGTSTELSYKNIPFYMSDRGYGVFVNNTGRVEYEVGSELVKKTGFSVEGESLDFFVICGDDNEYGYMKDVLVRYTAITGRPPKLPEWTFGLWLSTSFTTDYDEETVMSFIDGMEERGIPLSVFHFDCFWMKGMNWCDFTWDEKVFPDPVGMLKRIKAKGLKVCVWINPYIAQNSCLFAEGRDNGYFIKTTRGDVWQWDMWQSGMAIVDFTNPEAVKWYKSHLAKLLDMGVDCFKTDFGERIPVDNVVYYDGSDPMYMHNYYTHLYNKAVYEVICDKKGEGEAVLFARSATAGGQRYPVHWGGDCSSDYESMAESLRGGLSLTMSGFSFWSHDIGGFEEQSTADVYKRWVAFGLMSSHSRMHGSTSYRVPWNYGEEAAEVARTFSELKCKLMPYIYHYACVAAETGIPVMRSMILEFPEDKTCAFLDKQYMLGDELLVAPVFSPEGDVSVYLPNGKWTDYFTGDAYEGGRWYEFENVSYFTIPCFKRENVTNGSDYPSI